MYYLSCDVGYYQDTDDVGLLFSEQAWAGLTWPVREAWSERAPCWCPLVS